MLKKSLKYIISIIVLALIIYVTMSKLFAGAELRSIVHMLKKAKDGWLILGLSLLSVFVCTESVIIHLLFNSFNIKIKLVKCIFLSCISFFFCSITPGASGGQPVQIYYMTKCGADVLVGSLTVLIVTSFYKIVLMALCCVFLIFKFDMMYAAISDVPILFFLGVAFQIMYLVLMCLVLFRSELALTIVDKVTSFAKRHKLGKHPDDIQAKAMRSIRRYQTALYYIRDHKSIIPCIILLTVIQRLAFFSISYVVYRALGLSGYSWGDIVAMAIVLSVAVDALPLPGAAGANESVYVLLFRDIFGEIGVLTGLLITRGITFYSLILICGIMAIVGHFYILNTMPRQTKKERRFLRKLEKQRSLSLKLNRAEKDNNTNS